MIDKIKSFFHNGNARSIKAKKNILQMLFIRGTSILIGFVLLPLTVGYVNSETYGLWLTISSMVAWISFFDVGIGNGLRNRLAEALACEDYEMGRRYVSTTYAILSLIFIPLMLIIIPIAQFVDWPNILNVSTENSEGLLATISITIAYFCLNFILNTINVVIMAEQRPADASLRSLIQQIVSLIIIFVLTRTTEGNLVKLCLALCASPILVVAIFNFTLFNGRYKRIAPSLRYVDFKVAPSLLRLGVQFFIIQIAGVVQFQMTNFLIMRNFGGSEVTAYNVAYKYFNILMMVWTILITPLWVGFTDAIAQKDYQWVNNVFKRYTRLFYIFLIVGLIMLFISGFVYDIWMGEKVTIQPKMSFWVFVYNIVFMYATLYVNFLNGAGELRVQTIASCISPFIFLGVTFLLIHLGFGIESILIGSIAANFNGFLLAPIQTKHYLNQIRKQSNE
ncbi:MAG: hypothetical protein SO437_05485 [Candidatus Cryptobacteroides sp.]|nr:hypothetical protein [Candidatus Cryptobacteroides sp.]MDY5569582.1 hypothetical protein [Candidatus Cryptobacteroides sp.]